MNLVDLIRERRTVQSYSTEVVPSHVLTTAIELATYAPNHRCTFPWKFFRIGSSGRTKLGELAITLKTSKPGSAPLTEVARAAVMRKYTEEAELIIAGISKNEDSEIEREDYASLAMGLQNMSLYLWSEGYGSKWSSGKILNHPTTYEVVKQSPKNFTVCAFFWIGKASGSVRPVPRPEVSRFYTEVE